jgi:putative membrane protein
MRYVYISLIVVVTAVVLLFKIQNFEAVTVSLFGAGITMPTSLLIFVVYTLGMVTGSALLGLLRGWVKGAMRQGE